MKITYWLERKRRCYRLAADGETFFVAKFFRGPRKNAGWNLDSGLEIEHDPCWGVVAGVFLPARPSVNTAVRESDR